jgi:MFS family permease
MLATYLTALRASGRNVRLLLLLTFMMGFTIDGGIQPVIFNLYLVRMDFGPEFIGQVNSAGSAVFAVMSLMAGAIAGYWGRSGPRRTMVIGMAGMVIGTSLIPLADSAAPDWQARLIVGGILVAYGGLAAFYANLGPFLLLSARPSDRSALFAVQTAVYAMAAFAGGSLGGLIPGMPLTEPLPYRVPLLVISLTAVVALAVTLALRTPPAAETALTGEPVAPAGAPEGGLIQQSDAYRMIVFLAVVRFCQVGAISAASTFFNVFGDTRLGMSTESIGFIAAAARLISVPAALLAPAIAGRTGYGGAAILGSIGATLAILPLALIPQAGASAAGMIGIMIFTSIRYPTYFIYSMARTPERLRSLTSGAGEMAAGLSSALVSLAGGYLIVRFDFSAAFLLGGLLTLLSVFLLWWQVRRIGDIRTAH